jgi:hypothetical protein
MLASLSEGPSDRARRLLAIERAPSISAVGALVTVAALHSGIAGLSQVSSRPHTPVDWSADRQRARVFRNDGGSTQSRPTCSSTRLATERETLGDNRETEERT